MDTVEYEMVIKAEVYERQAAANLTECDRVYAFRERTQAALNAHARALETWRKASLALGVARANYYAAMARAVAP